MCCRVKSVRIVNGSNGVCQPSAHLAAMKQVMQRYLKIKTIAHVLQEYTPLYSDCIPHHPPPLAKSVPFQRRSQNHDMD
jgi:hypothetical protein